ncbi:hypothetical protein [Massilia sp. TSP1-1-2]|uniref:hypothetical protein n=1 Tax=Massilia sp. TSP1-1-2 TaxID=2804649 RepID=UPI003CFB44E0
MYWLTGRWVGKPEVPQVLEVRKQFPQVQPAGFSALWRQAVAHAEINFGCNIQSHNAYLETLLNPLGLVTTQTADE